MAPWRTYIPGINVQAIRLGMLLFATVFLATVMIASFVQPMPEWPRAHEPEETTESETANEAIPSEKPLPDSPSPAPLQNAVTEKNSETDVTLASAPTRVVAPNMTPAWAHVDKPLERIKDYRDEIDPRRKTASAYKNTIVLSAGTFKIRYGKRFIKIELNNVEAVPFRKRCRLKKGKVWPCGGTARAHLSRMLRQRTLFCNVEITGNISVRKTYPAQCWLGNTDVADIIIREGWGTAVDKGNNRQTELEAEAKRLRKGLWRKT